MSDYTYMDEYGKVVTAEGCSTDGDGDDAVEIGIRNDYFSTAAVIPDHEVPVLVMALLRESGHTYLADKLKEAANVVEGAYGI